MIKVREPPKVAYTCCKEAYTTISADLYDIAFAIGKFVSRHLHVSMHELPLEIGDVKGPLRNC